MILTQNPDTGYWTDFADRLWLTGTHDPELCEGRLCDIHNRRGAEPWASWPLNFRDDRGMCEVICPHGYGHPTAAQKRYWEEHFGPGAIVAGLMIHGDDGCCRGMYDQ